MNDSRNIASVASGVGKGTMFSLLRAAEVVEERLEGALSEVGLSMAKWAVLDELVASQEPLALCELATRLSCVRSNITQLVDRLEADGLVKRIDDPADRRSVRAALTPLGEERQAVGKQQVENLQAEFAERVGAADRARLDQLLGAIG
jgi:DNA-binding MarR family transcriptional regulator